MTISLDSLAVEVAALRTLDGRNEAGLTPAEFDDFRTGMGRLRRAYDAGASSMAHELARRSSPDLGAGGLARKDGFLNAQQSLGNTLGITPGQAGKLIDAGRALAPLDPPVTQADRDSKGAANGSEVPVHRAIPTSRRLFGARASARTLLRS